MNKFVNILLVAYIDAFYYRILNKNSECMRSTNIYCYSIILLKSKLF